MDYILYSYGSGASIASVFNAIAMVLNGNNKSFLTTFINLGAMTGLTIVLASVFQTQSISVLLKQWFLPMIITVNGLFVPTVRVNIVDVIIKSNHTQVANVPFGLAFVACGLSQLSHGLTKVMETSFASPDDCLITKRGRCLQATLFWRPNPFVFVMKILQLTCGSLLETA